MARPTGIRHVVAVVSGLMVLSGMMLKADETAGWYPFKSEAPTEDGVFGMSDWLEAPAGKHGRIQRKGDILVYGNNRIQLWGINNCFVACAPEQEMAERRARFYAKYGINTVRFHKYADGSGWSGILTEDSFVDFDPEGLDRMDYYIAQLKEQGIYVKLSPTFGPPTLGRKDAERLPFVKEFGDFGSRNRLRIPHSSIFFSPEIQDLQIEQMTNLLRHRNPYTGLTYAEDPVIWDLEIINEQSVLFFTSSHGLERSPTLRKQVGARFSEWLRKRYGDEKGLIKAWGPRALNSFEIAPSESMDEGTVLPLGNPNFWNPDALEGEESHRRRRHLDTLEFLTMLQMEFYQRYVDAVRSVGYEGEISASNWQAGRAFSHFANLWTDAQIGTIDRHNYFGGVRRDRATGETEVRRDSMLANAGSGMLSSGMQQVHELPFMLSEWIHVWPSDWGVEGPAIIGAYGLGLQGWDVSYMFQNRDDGQISPKLGSSRWDVAAPQVMGVFPAVARQVLRGDVETATRSAYLNVHAPSLFEGSGMDFDDQVAQGYDEKSFETGKVGRRTLAVARVQVKFTDEPLPTQVFNITEYQKDGALVSSTGQLRWHEADPGSETGGYIVIDTAGTQALVGFAEGKTADVGIAKITGKSHFGAVYLSALGPTDDLPTGKRILVTAIGRARNTGQKFDPGQTQLIEEGTEPILMEPVLAKVQLKRTAHATVRVLDHDGRLTERTVPIEDGVFQIDTGRDRTPYYLIDFTKP